MEAVTVNTVTVTENTQYRHNLVHREYLSVYARVSLVFWADERHRCQPSAEGMSGVESLLGGNRLHIFFASSPQH